ncbi:MAG: hypothetical protein P1T08_07340 [Acidimicrobiia bacterium]|nr:hypothetical protein [Acidimicrobiia bacterium]
MRRLYANLPGPVVVKVLITVVIVVAVLTALVFLFEWAGDLLDSGGVIGEPPA